MIVEPDALINAKANPDFWEMASSSAYTIAAVQRGVNPWPESKEIVQPILPC